MEVVADSLPIATRPLNIRSALTNDPLLLRGVDGRSIVARRYRDVAIALADDLGGQDKLSESCQASRPAGREPDHPDRGPPVEDRGG